ncbi:MAG TPA: hypothetical protein RMH99_17710 [Sandaracinaceae bacterium LLY-WYZ-13_1]|nr:hypothetical protein [Sandaracinaceae bacterium LLY-WYZ-13_1]
MAEDRDGDRDARRTLRDEEIVRDGRAVGRRRALGLVGAGAAGAVALATGCGGRVRATPVARNSGITDSDGGPCADPAGNGRGVTGITDSDGGQCADPVNRGRGGVAQTSGVTDSDSGAYADPAGAGRGGAVQTGITDSDGGPCADPAGGGRGHSGMTDSDGGPCADPAGRGTSGY